MRGFTAYERKALVSSLKKRERDEWANRLAFPLILLIIVLIGMTLDDVFHLTKIAQAQTTQVHDNAYYCQQLKETGERAIGTAKEREEACK